MCTVLLCAGGSPARLVPSCASMFATARVGAWCRKVLYRARSAHTFVIAWWTSLSVRRHLASQQAVNSSRTGKVVGCLMAQWPLIFELVERLPVRNDWWRCANRVEPFYLAGCPSVCARRTLGWSFMLKARYLVDPASSHMLVSKIKPCMSKYKPH